MSQASLDELTRSWILVMMVSPFQRAREGDTEVPVDGKFRGVLVDEIDARAGRPVLDDEMQLG